MSGPADQATITVNQRDVVAWRFGMTVSDLLREMNFTFPRVIVSINSTLVPHDACETTTIPAGANVRVIHLMAGG